MEFISTSIELFKYYKGLGDKTFDQINEVKMNTIPANESNSIAIIICHLHGNMLSRWTDFLVTDGEKPSRNRDLEFVNPNLKRQELINIWNEGWGCLFNALNSLEDEDLLKIVYIRNEGHTVQQAILRQIAHYSYHVGQIVQLAKILKGSDWVSLSIPKNKSTEYNNEKFAEERSKGFFTKKNKTQL